MTEPAFIWDGYKEMRLRHRIRFQPQSLTTTARLARGILKRIVEHKTGKRRWYGA